jgi:hypothetical protein
MCSTKEGYMRECFETFLLYIIYFMIFLVGSYVTQGTSMRRVAVSYMRGTCTVSWVIRDTCTAIWNQLQPNYLKPPTPEDWQRIIYEFYDR